MCGRVRCFLAARPQSPTRARERHHRGAAADHRNSIVGAHPPSKLQQAPAAPALGPTYAVPCSLSSNLSKGFSDPSPDADLARLLLGATRAFEREMLARLAQAGLDML